MSIITKDQPVAVRGPDGQVANRQDVLGKRIETALAVVEQARAACRAYRREDLDARLAASSERLARPAVHIVVIGEFKQGKSTLVNALVGADVCPVDDDIATAVPTVIRHGEQASASLIYADPGVEAAGDPLALRSPDARRQPVDPADLRRFVTEDAGPQRPLAVDVRLPRSMLASGLVLVDTPGLGGLGSRHSAASLAATSAADAVLFVTDASQELTATEQQALERARQMCPTVVCVVTKRDFYPRWRRIVELDQGHLSGTPDIDVLPVSSTLRAQAVATSDRELNEESGFPSLVTRVTRGIVGGAREAACAAAMHDVLQVCDQLSAAFEAERASLEDPERARAVATELRLAKERAQALKEGAARWSTTLNDGIADLGADIDHDLRGRIRRVIAEAEEAIDGEDPADTWPKMQAWLETRIATEVVANYAELRSRSTALSETVGGHFQQAAGDVLDAIAVFDPRSALWSHEPAHKAVARVDLEKMGARKQAFIALKGSTGGILMFTLLTSLTGLTALPALPFIAIPIGVLVGRHGLREEKKRKLSQRRAQAKAAVRKYCDEVSFVMAKDSRDTLRRVQRQLRDHYGDQAGQLQRSSAVALSAAEAATSRSREQAAARLRDVLAELGRITELKQRARSVADVSAGP